MLREHTFKLVCTSNDDTLCLIEFELCCVSFR